MMWIVSVPCLFTPIAKCKWCKWIGMTHKGAKEPSQEAKSPNRDGSGDW